MMKVLPMGKVEKHAEWDSREDLRPLLEQEVERVLGEKGDKEFIYELLCDDEIVERSRALFDGSEDTLGMEKLSDLMHLKKTAHVPAAEKKVCRAFLQLIVKGALGGQKDFPNFLLYNMIDDKDILAATVALKRGFENKDGRALMAARLKLWNLLGNAR